LRWRPPEQFFWARRRDELIDKMQYSQADSRCMLSGVRRIRPEIVGWSTAPRGHVINKSLGQVPEKLVAVARVLARTEPSPTQSSTKQGGPPHDHWAKLGRLGYTRTQYSPVMIALFSMKFIAPSSRKM
jgi:hypothetical protein